MAEKARKRKKRNKNDTNENNRRRNSSNPMNQGHYNDKTINKINNGDPSKIFVGGLTSEISEGEMRSFFGQFGNIVEFEMPYDKQKNQRKGFCFIIFDTEQAVKELLMTPKQTISGKEVDVKKATLKRDNMHK